jgi:translation initiation factor 3 subunit L
MGDTHRDDKPSDFLLPESVKSWFTLLYTHLISGSASEMARLYDREFHTLTNNYFKQSSWPEPAAIAPLVDDDATFLVLYKQLYFRHMFSKLSPTFDFKIASWDNYCEIFDGVLDGSLEVDALPSQWTFDLVNEFVYQYQSFAQYRAKVAASSKNDQETAQLEAHSGIWDTTKVLNYLHAIVHKSNIRAVLKKEDAAPSEFLQELGYYALICLSRAHVLYGDYYTSLQLLAPIDFYNKGGAVDGKKATDQIHEKAPLCHVSVFYHRGVAQLMLEDFAGAIRSFSTIILQVHRSRNYYARFADYDQLNKHTEKALALLAIALFLCPSQRVNEQLHAMIRDKYSDKQSKLQKGDLAVLNDWFSFATPKFILPTILPATTTNRSQEVSQLQLANFIAIVERQQHVPSLRAYVKLYRSISLDKLARFRGVDVDTVRSELIAYKRNGDATTAAANARPSQSDVHCYLENDVVRVDDELPNQRTGDFFMNHIHRFARVVAESA